MKSSRLTCLTSKPLRRGTKMNSIRVLDQCPKTRKMLYEKLRKVEILLPSHYIGFFRTYSECKHLSTFILRRISPQCHRSVSFCHFLKCTFFLYFFSPHHTTPHHTTLRHTHPLNLLPSHLAAPSSCHHTTLHHSTSSSGLSGPSLYRLKLTSQKIRTLVEGIRSIAKQEEPIGEVRETARQAQDASCLLTLVL
jgi:hypothetical protein